MAKTFTWALLLMLSSFHHSLADSTQLRMIKQQEDIQCYSLPYGGIGFTSHIITFYVVVMLWNQRSPWRFHKLSQKGFSLVLSAICLTATFGTAVANISRCHFRNSFEAVAFTEILLSLCFGCLCWNAAWWIGRSKEVTDPEAAAVTESDASNDQTTASKDTDFKDADSKDTATENVFSADIASEITAIETPSSEDDKKEKNPHLINGPEDVFWWMVPYSIGASVTMAGLLRLVVWNISQNRAMERISLIFGTLAATFVIFMVIVMTCSVAQDKTRGWSHLSLVFSGTVGMIIMGIGFLGPLYTDWIFGAIGGNLSGVVSSRHGSAAIYWVYFVARLLPFFSF